MFDVQATVASCYLRLYLVHSKLRLFDLLEHPEALLN